MKRKRGAHVRGRAPKRTRIASDQSASATPTPAVDHPVLRRLYPEVFSLRHYLLARLPGSSKNRRRRISQFGLSTAQESSATNAVVDGIDVELGQLLDSTLVGVFPKPSVEGLDEIADTTAKDLEAFSQQLPHCASGSTFKAGYFQQSETVDFVIWLLFKRSTTHRPSHLLCHGFQRGGSHSNHGFRQCATQCIPGISTNHTNDYVNTLKGPVWRRLHSLLGVAGSRIIVDLLVDCAIFVRIEGNPGNFYQLSGAPISDIKPEDNASEDKEGAAVNETRRPSTITFVRSRMLYARAALNAKGGIRFGMRHIHVLNRFPDRGDHAQSVHIMRYIFPRQFGLHNVFTSKIDIRDTAMPFKDYTLREDEIRYAKNLASTADGAPKVPKRLRGEATALVQKLRALNQRCSYAELLRHYCSVEGIHLSAKPDWRKNPLQPIVEAAEAADKGNDGCKANTRTVEQTCFTDMTCPTAHVSAFCRAVIAKVIPNGFWGGDHNKRIIMYWIDRFVSMRRFENLTLHQVTQKLQISSLAWLQLPGRDTASKMAKTDSDKRQEIFLEFIYWVFDSFLIPLIRTNFHVTESNAHRNRLFYFRHDIWRMLAEPSLSVVRMKMFEEMPTERTLKLLSYRKLGFSKLRLLPKAQGARVITNLRRRQEIMRNGTMVLGRSINTVLGPAFSAITHEKSLHPETFGSSLFSVADMFPKLAAFRDTLEGKGLAGKPLYFAKADVQSCFDTIPQKRLLSMVQSLMPNETYVNGKHVEITPQGHLQQLSGQHADLPPRKKYIPHSIPGDEAVHFESLIRDKFVGAKANTVFVDTAVQQLEMRDDLLQLLHEHIERNVVKIGKRFYRQKTGIPQGSVLSSLLCNYFYADFERKCLSSVLDEDSLLLRLLDDFCLITTNQEHAERFMQIMHRGNAEYGIIVKAAKSLTNFESVTDSGYRVPRNVSDVTFPFCGILIDMRTLEVCKNGERTGQASIADSLTVDLAKVPGQTFHRKALNAFKIQLKAMFIDTSFNSVPTVLANLYQSFFEAAVRCFEYNRSLSKVRPTHSRLLIKTVDGIAALAVVLLQRRTRSKAAQNVERVRSLITRKQVQWLACKAFDTVFQRRQTQHRALLAWLGSSLAAVRPPDSAERCILENATAWQAAGGSAGGEGTGRKRLEAQS